MTSYSRLYVPKQEVKRLLIIYNVRCVLYVMNNRQLYSKLYSNIGVESARFLQTSIFNYFEPEFPVIMKACFKHQKVRGHMFITVGSFLS